MEWETLVSIASILISLGLGLWVLSVHHRQNELQERLTLVEEDRRRDEVRESLTANLAIQAERRPKGGKTQPCLRITNIGKAEARGISFDPQELSPMRGIGVDRMPIPSLGPTESTTFDLVIADQMPSDYTFEVSWTDETGSRSRNVSIHVP